MRYFIAIFTIQLFYILSLHAQIKSEYDDCFSIPDELIQKTPSEIKLFETYYSFDKVWFKNKQLNATLIIELGTDLFRSAYFLIKSDFIDSCIYNQIQIDEKTGLSTYDYIRDDKIKKQAFKFFVDSAKEIDKKYFTSKYGISLGLRKVELVRKFKKPNKIASSKGIDIYYWTYKYDKSQFESPEGLPKDMGVHVEMYFKADKLVAMIIFIDNLG